MRSDPKPPDALRSYYMQSPVLLAQPVFNHVLTVFFAALLAVGLAFAGLVHYSQHETVQGEITAASGFSAVTVDRGGIISELRVKPGERVRKGQVLAVLSIPPVVAADGDTSAFAIARMGESLENIDVQMAEYQRSVAEAEAQLRQIDSDAAASVAAAQSRKRLSEDRRRLVETRLKGYEALAQKGYVAQVAVDEIRASQLQLQQEATEADLTIGEIRRARSDRRATMEARVRDLRQAALSSRTQRLQTENLLHERQALQSVSIVAPADGVASAVSVRGGERVESGQRIFAIGYPSARLTAVLEVPSKAIGLVEAGQRVVLKYDAFPYQTFGVRYGRVTRVEQASLQAGAAADPEQKELDRRFLVEVLPDEPWVSAYGRPRPIKVGMLLTAEIETERRNLLAWFLSPLFALKGRLS